MTVKTDLKANQYLSEGLLYLLWRLSRINKEQPFFEFGFEYIKPPDWDHKKMMRHLFPLEDQFGITLQSPRFEKGYFEDSFPEDYEAIIALNSDPIESPFKESFVPMKKCLSIRKKILNDKKFNMEDVRLLLRDAMPINIEASLLEGIWFEVRVDDAQTKKISAFLKTYLSNFAEDRLAGKPQDLASSLQRRKNFYTFDKHLELGLAKLNLMKEKFGNKFIILGQLNDNEEFLHIHTLFVLEYLGHILIRQLGTSSGAYTHGDNPKYEADVILQPNKNQDTKTKKGQIEKLEIIKSTTGGNRYSVVVSGDYQNPIHVDAAKPTWDALLKVANSEPIDATEHKTSIDYLNSNKNCKLYTQTGHQITKIVKIESGYVVPNVNITYISEKAFRQRQNRGRKMA